MRRDKVEGPCLFQHKLRLWDGEIDQSSPYARYQIELNYRLTIHVASSADFDYLILRDIPSLSQAGAMQRPIYEFRDDPPPNNAEEHWCFAGYRRERDLDSTPVDGGHLTRLLGCEIHDQRFYPGVHLNLILPQFEVRWESPQVRIRLALQALRWKLLTRLGDERRIRHLEVQRLSLSHSRSPFFAPHVTARVDYD